MCKNHIISIKYFSYYPENQNMTNIEHLTSGACKGVASLKVYCNIHFRTLLDFSGLRGDFSGSGSGSGRIVSSPPGGVSWSSWVAMCSATCPQLVVPCNVSATQIYKAFFSKMKCYKSAWLISGITAEILKAPGQEGVKPARLFSAAARCQQGGGGGMHRRAARKDSIRGAQFIHYICAQMQYKVPKIAALAFME